MDNTTIPSSADNLASLQKRAMAYVIDDVIISILIFVIYFDMFTSVSGADNLQVIASSVFGEILALKLLYHTFFVWGYHATPGKMILKIKVITTNESLPITPFQALLRAALRIASEIFFYIGFLLAFFDPVRRTLHDKFSNTLVTNV